MEVYTGRFRLARLIEHIGRGLKRIAKESPELLVELVEVAADTYENWLDGELEIDALIVDMDAAEAKRGFIGPIEEKPYYKSQRSGHDKASEVVKVVAMAVSIYSLLAELPTLVKQWGQVQATVRQLTQSV